MANDLLGMFQSFRTILCICPQCNEIQRLSDLHLKYNGNTAKTWLDEYEVKVRAMQEKERAFAEKEEELRQKATERGRKKVPQILKNSMSAEFTKLPYNPYDIKALLHPVDFMVFDGLNEKDTLDEIVLLSKKTDNPHLNQIRRSIQSTVKKGNYKWQVVRVDGEGKVQYEGST